MAMNTILTKSAQSIQASLQQKGLEFVMVEMPASTHTALDAANAVSAELAQIVKSLILSPKIHNDLYWCFLVVQSVSMKKRLPLMLARKS